MDNENVVYFVCVAGRDVVGQAACSIFPAKPSSRNPFGLAGYIHVVSVTADQHSKGIGKMLVTTLFRHCREASVGYIMLDATGMGELLYRLLGFTDTDNVYLEMWKAQLDALDLGD